MNDNNIDLQLFANRFTELLNSSEENTYSIANKLGLSPATISRYANGIMKPKVPTVKSIAQIFGVNYAWLMGKNVPMKDIQSRQDENNNIDNELNRLFSLLTDAQKNDILVKIALMISENNQKE